MRPSSSAAPCPNHPLPPPHILGLVHLSKEESRCPVTRLASGPWRKGKREGRGCCSGASQRHWQGMKVFPFQAGRQAWGQEGAAAGLGGGFPGQANNRGAHSPQPKPSPAFPDPSWLPTVSTHLSASTLDIQRCSPPQVCPSCLGSPSSIQADWAQF